MKKKKAISKRLPQRCIAILLLLAMLLSIVPGPFLTAVAAELESGTMQAGITDPTADTAGNTEAAAETTADTAAATESAASTAATTESTASTEATAESTVDSETTEATIEATENTAAADTKPVETTFATIAAEEPILSDTSTDIPAVSSVGSNEVVPLADSGHEQSNIKDPSPGQFSGPPSDPGFDPGTYPEHQIYYSAAGVTMQVVLLPYGKTYQRNGLYDSIINLVKNYTYTGKNGNKIPTVYDGITITENTFVGDPITGRVFKLDNIEFDQTVVSETNGRKLYKTVPLVNAGPDGGRGATLHPGFHATVSGAAKVSTENGITTYTMPKRNDIEKFLQKIIFGTNGDWDENNLAKDAAGNPTHILAEDVSLYKKLLKYLGCEDEYIQNYLDAYNCRLSPEIPSDAEKLVPTIIWSFVVADCTWVKGNGTYGFGYTGDASVTDKFIYVDNDAEPCCNGKGVESGTKHGTVSGKTFIGFPNRQIITQVLTVGDIVYTSFSSNISNGSTGLNSPEVAKDYFNRWWRGIALDENPEKMDGYAATNEGGASARYAYNKYHNKGKAGNSCSWYGEYSWACELVFGNHNLHNKYSWQRDYFGWHSFGAGFVNSINGEGVDASTGKQHYYRGFWSPYGIQRTGSLAIQKDITSEEASARTDLAGWKFELYETQADAQAGKNYFNGAYTDSTGKATFKGLAAGHTYYIKEAPLERQDKRHALSGWTTEDEIFTGTVTENNVILVGTAYNTYVSGIPVSISKSPKCSNAVYAQIQNNPLYSLAGAEYTVYLNSIMQEVLVTDAHGNATSTKMYQVGDALTIKETKAPAGFKLDSTVYSHTVNETDNNVEVTDEPVFDPSGFMFKKNNSTTGTAMGNTSYQGAIFKWEFWEGTSNNGNPTHTWYFETDEAGFYNYDTEYITSKAGYRSDNLYTGISSYIPYELPLGYLVVTEVVAPEGYALMQPLHATITQDQPGGSAAFNWTEASKQYITQEAGGTYLGEEPLDIETFGSFSMVKMDYDMGSTSQGDVPNLKAKFQIINRSTGPVKIGSFAAAAPGKVCYEFWTGADGKYRSPDKLLPIGSYEIKEAQAPNGMTLNTTWSKTFTVTAQNKVFDFTADPCYDKVIRGGVKVYKEDSVLGANTGADAKLDGITYSVISLNNNPVIVSGVRYNRNDAVATMELAWNRSEGRWTAATANNLLPYGTYKVVENPMAEGSGYANDSYLHSTEEYVFSIRNNNEFVSTNTASSQMVFHNTPVGGLTIRKFTNTGTNLAGWIFEVRDSRKAWVATVTTNDQGIATVENLKAGTYTVKEIGNTNGQWNSPNWAYDVTTRGDVYIGPMNLLDKPELNDMSYWIGTNATTLTASTHDGKSVIHVDPSTGTRGSGHCAQRVGNIKTGTYTFSVDIYCEASQQQIFTIWDSSWNNLALNYFQIQEGWNHVEFTHTFEEDPNSIIIGIGGYKSGKTFDLYHPKFEVGSTASQWSPTYNGASVTVSAGEITTHTVQNNMYGRIEVLKKANTNSDLDLKGWEISIYTDEACTQAIEGSPFTTDSNGRISVNNLLSGTYYIKETGGVHFENPAWKCDGEVYPVVVEMNHTGTLTITNELLPAKISVEKVNPNGEHLAGAKFLFEWSADGITWNPVTFNDTELVVWGGCSNADMRDGTLTTDETGILTVAGLHPLLQYRVTEIEAPSGYVLLSDHAFVGTIPADSLTVTLKVCNSYGYQLPSSGEEGFTAMIASGTFLLLIALLSTVLLVSRRAQTTKVCYSKTKLNKNKIS